MPPFDLTRHRDALTLLRVRSAGVRAEAGALARRTEDAARATKRTCAAAAALAAELERLAELTREKVLRSWDVLARV